MRPRRENGSSGKVVVDFTALQIIMVAMTQPTIDALLAQFKALDKYGEGRISTDEVRQLLMSCGDKLTEEKVDAIMREISITSDDQVSYESFVDSLTANQ